MERTKGVEKEAYLTGSCWIKEDISFKGSVANWSVEEEEEETEDVTSSNESESDHEALEIPDSDSDSEKEKERARAQSLSGSLLSSAASTTL